MAQVRDLSARARLELSGPDRVRFLHGMVTNDIEGLAPGQGCHAAMLTTKGKMIADLVVYAEEHHLLLGLDAELREKIFATIHKHIIMDDCEVCDLTDETAELGVYGADAAHAIARWVGVDPSGLAPYHHLTHAGVRVARTRELGPDSFHLMGLKQTIAALPVDAPALADDAFERARIEAGTPRYGVDMGEDRLPIEAGIDDAVSLTKGCYLGQEVIARATNLGHINKKLVGVKLASNEPLAPGTKLSHPTRPEAGVVTSSVFSPKIGTAIALAYVHRTLWDPGTKLDQGEVVPLPFA